MNLSNQTGVFRISSQNCVNMFDVILNIFLRVITQSSRQSFIEVESNYRK